MPGGGAPGGAPAPGGIPPAGGMPAGAAAAAPPWPASVPKMILSNLRFRVFDSKPSIAIGFSMTTSVPIATGVCGTAAQISPAGPESFR